MWNGKMKKKSLHKIILCSKLSFAFLPESSAALAFEGKTVPLLFFLPAKSSERIPFPESC